HEEVARRLVAAAAVGVPRDADLGAKRAPDPRLLLDLAQRAVLVALARVVLALRKRPVVVSGAVDDENLRRPRGVPPGDEAARGRHGPGHRPACRPARFAGFPAFGGAPRAARRRARSRSTSRPAAPAASADPCEARVRIRRSATIAS